MFTHTHPHGSSGTAPSSSMQTKQRFVQPGLGADAVVGCAMRA
jgi:hypothetical protein